MGAPSLIVPNLDAPINNINSAANRGDMLSINPTKPTNPDIIVPRKSIAG